MICWSYGGSFSVFVVRSFSNKLQQYLRQTKVTYAKKSGDKNITVAKNGNITVKKGLKKGTYKVVVNVTAAGNSNYNKLTKAVTVKITVK